MTTPTTPTSTAIVTGGSRGLGRALTAALARSGWNIVIDARDDSVLHEAATTLGPRVHPIAGDVTDPAHRHQLVAAAHDLGGVDLLVNNAGALGPSPLPPVASYPAAALSSLLEVNVIAPLALVQRALPFLRASGGAIVNVTSDAAVEAYPGWGGYGASKAALEQLSRVLAAEEPELRVWWFDPGDMRTQMHQDAFPGEDISDRPDPAQVVPALLAIIEQRPPSGRLRASDTLVGSGT